MHPPQSTLTDGNTPPESDPPPSTTQQDTANSFSTSTLQTRWQTAWQESNLFHVPSTPQAPQDSAYILALSPLHSPKPHLNHLRSHCLSDSHARFLRARGQAVLFSIGFHTFGLPTELQAIQQHTQPALWTENCLRQARDQLQLLGISIDPSRQWSSSEPDIYRWSQRLFLLLLDAGLIQHTTAQVDWCDNCQTILTGSQVQEHLCWCCRGPIRSIQRPHWSLHFGSYISENEQRLEELSEWNELALSTQREIPGGQDGVEFSVTSLDGSSLTVFTPHAHAIKQAEFVAISPNHPDIAQWLGLEEDQPADQDSGARDPSTPVIIDTNRIVTGAGTANPLPVVVSPSVDERFGHTAILGIPAVDAADATLAKHIKAPSAMTWRIKDNGPSKVTPARRYTDRDIPISRPRAWGTPIPIVHCQTCGPVPVAIEDLPITLPSDLQTGTSANPLAQDQDFLNCPCPRCSSPAQRESDTLDPYFDGLWQWMASCVPAEARAQALFEHPELKRWLPVKRVIRNSERSGLTFDQRITAKALRDQELLPPAVNGEPFAGLTMHDGIDLRLLDGTLDLDHLVQRAGADAVRLTILYGAAPQNTLTWTEHAFEYCNRWLSSFWQYALPRLEQSGESSDAREHQGSPVLERRLAKACRIATERVTENYQNLQMHRAIRNVMMLLVRIEDFEQRAIDQHSQLTAAEKVALKQALQTAVRLLAPITPHIAEELWARSGGDGVVASLPWPGAKRPAE